MQRQTSEDQISSENQTNKNQASETLITIENQTTIRRFMEALGYREISEDGLCFGFSCMAMQAILSNQLDQFVARLVRMETLYKKFEHDKGNDDFETYFESNLEGNEKEERSDFREFLDGIYTYQSATEMNHLFRHNTPHQQSDLNKFLSLLQPSNEDNIDLIELSIDFYTATELEKYFQTLHETFKTLNVKKPFSLILCSGNHAINISYDPSNQTHPWVFIDITKIILRETKVNKPDSTEKKANEIVLTESKANEPDSTETKAISKKFELERIAANDYTALANKTAQAFPMALGKSTNGITGFYALGFSTEENILTVSSKSTNGMIGFNPFGFSPRKNLLNPILHALENNVEWKNIHAMTDEKTQRVDVFQFNLLYLACQQGNLNIVKQILEKNKSIINGVASKIPLHVAVQNNHLDIVNYLLEQGADVNRHLGCNFSQIIIFPKNSSFPDILKREPHIVYLRQDDQNRFECASSTFKSIKFTAAFSKALQENHGLTIDENAKIIINKQSIVENVNGALKRQPGINALHTAAYHGHAKMIKTLVKHGANIDLKTNKKETAQFFLESKANAAKGIDKIVIINAGRDMPLINNRDVNTLYIKKGYISDEIYISNSDNPIILLPSVMAKLNNILLSVESSHKEENRIEDPKLVFQIATLCGYPDLNKNEYLEERYSHCLQILKSEKDKLAHNPLLRSMNNPTVTAPSSTASTMPALIQSGLTSTAPTTTASISEPALTASARGIFSFSIKKVRAFWNVQEKTLVLDYHDSGLNIDQLKLIHNSLPSSCKSFIKLDTSIGTQIQIIRSDISTHKVGFYVAKEEEIALAFTSESERDACITKLGLEKYGFKGKKELTDQTKSFYFSPNFINSTLMKEDECLTM